MNLRNFIFVAAGLAFAADLPARCLTPGKPDSFWDFTNAELFVDPKRGGGAWSGSCTQLWFTPVRDGDTWRLAAGRWVRGGTGGAIADERCRTSVTQRVKRVTSPSTVSTSLRWIWG